MIPMTTISDVRTVEIYFDWRPNGWRIHFFGAPSIPSLKAVVDDFGCLVVVP